MKAFPKYNFIDDHRDSAHHGHKPASNGHKLRKSTISDSREETERAHMFDCIHPMTLAEIARLGHDTTDMRRHLLGRLV